MISDGRKRNGGHGAILSKKQQEELLNILKNEKPPDLGLWSGPKVAKWITEKTGRKVSRGKYWLGLHDQIRFFFAGVAAKTPAGRPNFTGEL